MQQPIIIALIAITTLIAHSAAASLGTRIGAFLTKDHPAAHAGPPAPHARQLPIETLTYKRSIRDEQEISPEQRVEGNAVRALSHDRPRKSYTVHPLPSCARHAVGSATPPPVLMPIGPAAAPPALLQPHRKRSVHELYSRGCGCVGIGCEHQVVT
jgi:hypothetical protein